MRTPLIESLESRTMFASLNIMATGRLGSLSGWMNVMSSDFSTRVGGASKVPRYILTISPDDHGQLKADPITHVGGTPTPQASSNADIILEIDYIGISADVNYSLDWIAGVTANFILGSTVDGIRLGELPIHEIGVSRGTGLMDELAKAFGQAGVWVEQETSLDPAPISLMGDKPPILYDNVEFMDNYWRTDNDPTNTNTDGADGQPYDGAFNSYLPWLEVNKHAGELTHLRPAGYYIGTINYNQTYSGEGPIETAWYDTTQGRPARDQTGFYYSAIVGGTRPLSGIWQAGGGQGVRVATGQANVQQWANITAITLAGGNSFTTGAGIQIKYLQQDRDSGNTVTFYMDPDRNPYNNNNAMTLGSKSHNQAGSVTSGSFNANTNGLAPGTYYICAKIEDSQGHVRYGYSQPVIVAALPPIAARVASDKILRISGTEGADTIKIYKTSDASTEIIVSINGRTANFSLASIEKIYVSGLGGNDYIAVVETHGKIFASTRLSGGDGNDTLQGGSGRDTILGDAGNDRLYGGEGRDFLTGGDGTDRLYGQGGKDTFIGAKTKEIIDFLKGDLLAK